MSGADILVLVVTLSLMAVVVEFVRRRQLKESLAVVWLALGGCVVVFGLGRRGIDWAAEQLGISYGASLTFMLAIVALVLMALYLSIQVTRLSDRVEKLGEEVAFLRGVRQPEDRNPEVEAP